MRAPTECPTPPELPRKPFGFHLVTNTLPSSTSRDHEVTGPRPASCQRIPPARVRPHFPPKERRPAARTINSEALNNPAFVLYRSQADHSRLGQVNLPRRA